MPFVVLRWRRAHLTWVTFLPISAYGECYSNSKICFHMFRCFSCCCSVVRENCGYKNGTWPIRTRPKRRLHENWWLQYLRVSPRCARSSSGKIVKSCINGKWELRFNFWLVLKFHWFVYSYASLYFCCAIEQNDNELLTLEIIHRYVELLDKYFGSVSEIYYNTLYDVWWYNLDCLQVCELDIIFNFEKAYFILDELLIGGEIQETSKKNVLKAIASQDLLQEVSTPETYDL